jgi:hypothetical protein
MERGHDDLTQYKSNDFASCLRRLAIVGKPNGRKDTAAAIVQNLEEQIRDQEVL